MQIVLGGLRGSWPIAARNVMKYGGETTSVLVEGEGGERILLDLGTGARALGDRLAAQPHRELLVLLTHYHLDHVIGLPSFAPIYDGSFRIEFAAPMRGGRSIREVMPRLLEDPFWPLQMDALHADISFRTLRGHQAHGPLRRGGLDLRWTDVAHPAGCTAYRLDEPSTGAAFVFATDVEWDTATPAMQEAFLRLCREPAPPSLLIFDGHFTPREYENGYRGWGHSTWKQAVDIARSVDAQRLLITHHSPSHNDADLARLDAQVRKTWSRAAIGREKQIIRLPAL